VHVALAVASDVVDVDIQNVRAFAFLLARQRDEAIPILRRSRIFFEPEALTRSPTIKNEAS
jgi:hypothetical protein